MNDNFDDYLDEMYKILEEQYDDHDDIDEDYQMALENMKIINAARENSLNYNAVMDLFELIDAMIEYKVW